MRAFLCALCLAVAAVLGCATVEGELRRPEPRAGSGALMAGAARADLTPPPGFPMGGHSIEGRVALGTWTRLHARTLYLEGPRGTPLVLTITDLWGMPAGLSDRVAELVAAHDGTGHIGREHIVLAATHTHHGPANFATSRVFSRFVGPKPGFDRALFEFVAMRIAQSIADAVAAAQPAAVAFSKTSAPAVARNRSLPPFLENPEAESILAANDVDGCHLDPLPEEGKRGGDPCEALMPDVDVVHVTAAADPQTLIGVLAVFAVHPTAMPNRTLVYSGDLVSVAAARAEAALRKRGAPVVAIFNGAEGDVSPNWSTQGRAETVRLGDRLADAILAVQDVRPRLDAATIDVAYEIVPMADQAFVDAQGELRQTAPRGLPGTATLGGAEDGRTRWHSRGMVEGRVAKRERLAGQGPKRPAVPAALLEMSLPKSHVPRDVPIGVYRVGPIVFTTLPGEFTTTMGLRIRRRVAESAGVPLGDVVALGLASGHLEYFTTPQEYALQHYEGSSTFYGPFAGARVAVASGELSARQNIEVPDAFAYRAGRSRRMRTGGRAPTSRQRAALNDVLSVDDIGALPAFAFDDAAPPWPPATSRDAVVPTVRVVARDESGAWTVRADDEGVEIATLTQGSRAGRAAWKALWLEPSGEGLTRFEIVGVDGVRRCSEAFSPKSTHGTVDEASCS